MVFGQSTPHGRGIGDPTRAKALLYEIAFEQIAQAQVVIDDEDVAAFHGTELCRASAGAASGQHAYL